MGFHPNNDCANSTFTSPGSTLYSDCTNFTCTSPGSTQDHDCTNFTSTSPGSTTSRSQESRKLKCSLISLNLLKKSSKKRKIRLQNESYFELIFLFVPRKLNAFTRA